MNRFTKMKVLLLVFSFLTIAMQYTQAQQIQLEWAKQMGGGSNDEGGAMVVDKDGNAYITGNFSGTADFDPGSAVYNLISAGRRDIYVAKYDVSGNLVWAKQMGGNNNEYGNGIAVDNSNNVYITGHFFDTADFNPGSGIFNLISAGAGDVFIVKLNASGDFVWAKSIGGKSPSLRHDIGFSTTTDNNNNVLVTGQFSDTVDLDPGPGVANAYSKNGLDIFIVKLNSDGDFLWGKNIGGVYSNDQGRDIVSDSIGNIYVTGSFRDTIDFDPGPGVHAITVSTPSSFLLKLDSMGSFVFAKVFSGSGYTLPYSVTLDKEENILVGGTFANGTTDFDPGIDEADTFFITPSGIINFFVASYDAFIVKLDNNGDFLWARQLGGPGNEQLWDISTDDYGNVFSTGTFVDTGDYDPGPCVYNLYQNREGANNIMNSFVSKLDKEGKFVWAKSWGGITMTQFLAIVPHANNIYVHGSFSSDIDVDPGPDTSILVPIGSGDVFVFKLSDSDRFQDYYTIYGPEGFCPGGTYTYSVATRENDSLYIWQIPDGWSGSSNSSSITVTAGAEGGTVIVQAISCDTIATLSLDVQSLIDPVDITIDSFVLGTTPNDYDTWQWFLDGNVISGATDPQYEVLQNGEYSVVVTKGDCNDTAYYTVTNVSVEQFDLERQVTLYPNPNNGRLFINVSQPFTDGRIRLISLTGQTIMEGKALKGNQFMYDLTPYPTGIYFVELEEKMNTVRLKLVKE